MSCRLTSVCTCRLVAQQDEIDALATTAAQLSATLAFLKHRAGVQDVHSVAQTACENAALRQALATHALHVAGARSMLSADSVRVVRGSAGYWLLVWWC